jgi:dTDP-4-amino-4,6-dideoxygalactose transaminase
MFNFSFDSAMDYLVPFFDLPKRHVDRFSDYCDELKHQIKLGDFILGSAVREFESDVTQRLGKGRFLTCGNCTDALFLSLKYLRDKHNGKTEVIVTPMSYLASVSSIILAGCNPVFADIDDSLNIDARSVSKLISKHTLAVLAVHLGGIPANMKLLCEVCESASIPVIEDCAQAFGGRLDGRSLGTFGFAGCFSFHPLKIFGGLGDGGGIVSSSDEFIQYFERARNHGHSSREDVHFFSHNMRMDSLTARFLRRQLPYLNDEMAKRRSIRATYIDHFNRSGLIDRGAVVTPVCQSIPDVSLNFAMFRFKLRDDLQNFLKSKRVEALVHYPKLLSELHPFGDRTFNDIPLAKKYVNEILSLPCSSHIGEEQISYVCDSVTEFYRTCNLN